MSNQKPSNKNLSYPFPSVFGSHRSMMIKDNEDGTVICKDEFGEYTTLAIRLDNHEADPNRYPESRIQALWAGKKEKGKE